MHNKTNEGRNMNLKYSLDSRYSKNTQLHKTIIICNTWQECETERQKLLTETPETENSEFYLEINVVHPKDGETANVVKGS
jgi:hypothetical protein